MKRNLKRNIVMAAVLLFVCAAVYLNWSYSKRYGEADSAMVKAEDAADYIFGYTIVNDVSARNLQTATGSGISGRASTASPPWGPAS